MKTRNEFRQDLRHKKTRRGKFARRMIHTPRELSDLGRGAAATAAQAEVEPLWLKLFRNTAAKLPRTGKQVLRALLTDFRTMPAAQIAGVSRPTIDHWKKQFQIIFAQCFRAYERTLRQK